jgi:hypothetical protein
MSDESPGSSGNRWEPTDQTGQPDRAHEPDHPDQPTAVSRRRSWLTRTRTAVAGGAAAVLLAGGLGGFAIGRATADPDGSSGVDRQGVPTGFDRDGDGRGPGGPTGQVPGGQDGQQDDGANGTDT